MTRQEHIDAVADYGFTERQAQFLVLVMRHAGLCVKRQYAALAGIANGGEKCNAFFDKLVSRGFAVAGCGDMIDSSRHRSCEAVFRSSSLAARSYANAAGDRWAASYAALQTGSDQQQERNPGRERPRLPPGDTSRRALRGSFTSWVPRVASSS